MAGMNHVFKGFTQSSKYAPGSRDGTETIREFKFASVNPALSQGTGTSASSKTTGCVKLGVWSGKLEETIDSALPTFRYPENAENSTNVDEKTAIKAGCSVKTAREDTEKGVPVKRIPGKFVATKTEEPKVITVYFREKYWLQSRSIIDGDGNLWKPTIDKTTVDLTEEENGSDKNIDIDGGENDEPKKKKARTQVPDSALVKDTIKLTADWMPHKLSVLYHTKIIFVHSLLKTIFILSIICPWNSKLELKLN